MDLTLIETGSGGDLVLDNTDLSIVNGFENMPFMEMFGSDGQPWWGNDLLEPEQQYFCRTQAALLANPLTSSGLIEINKAINADLEAIAQNVPGTTVNVTLQIVSDNRLSILITINGQAFSYYWNPVTAQLINRI